MNHLNDRIEIEKKHGQKKLLVPTLDGKEREWLRSQGYTFQSVEPTHCEISWE